MSRNLGVVLRVLPLIICLLSTAFGDDPDFIVVGGGTAGCVLAARLCSALPESQVVLLERGIPRNSTAEFLVRSPRKALDARRSPLVAEFWQSLPNKELFGTTHVIRTGNTLGGSSSVNGMQWSLPLGPQVSSWGVQGLSDSTARKYYRRAYRKARFSQPPEPLRHRYADLVISAAKEVGFKNKFNPFTRKVRRAIWYHAVSITPTGRRIDSCTAYVLPELKNRCQHNLKVQEGATVTKVLLTDSKPRRAFGVEYVDSQDRELQNRKILKAKREVLVAAGPFGSPKLLQLSGIGNAERLKKLGIEPKVELGVGERTQGRGFVPVVSQYTGVPLEPANDADLVNSPEQRRRWEEGRSSVLGQVPAGPISPVSGAAYINTYHARNGAEFNVPLLPSACICNPASFGSLHIKDSNPFSSPDVQLNLMGSAEDRRRAALCVEAALKIHRHLPAIMNVTVVLPTAKVSDELVRNLTGHGLHFVGGCPVGSVLHPNLKVRGVEGLRVIDASSLSEMTRSAGPFASVYMLAEYASEKIAMFYKCKLNKLDKRKCRNVRAW